MCSSGGNRRWAAEEGGAAVLRLRKMQWRKAPAQSYRRVARGDHETVCTHLDRTRKLGTAKSAKIPGFGLETGQQGNP